MRKPVFGVSNQVRHKPGCVATEDGQRLENLDLGSRGSSTIYVKLPTSIFSECRTKAN